MFEIAKCPEAFLEGHVSSVAQLLPHRYLESQDFGILGSFSTSSRLGGRKLYYRPEKPDVHQFPFAEKWGTFPPVAVFLLSQLPNPLLQELALWFLLGQGQSLLIGRSSLGCPAEPAVHIGTG